MTAVAPSNAQDRCNDAGLALRSEAVALGNGATVAFIAGAAVLAGGVVLFATAPPKASAKASRASVSLRAGGFVLTTAF